MAFRLADVSSSTLRATLAALELLGLGDSRPAMRIHAELAARDIAALLEAAAEMYEVERRAAEDENLPRVNSKIRGAA